MTIDQIAPGRMQPGLARIIHERKENGGEQYQRIPREPRMWQAV